MSGSEPMTYYRGEMIPRSEYESRIAGENDEAPIDDDIASYGLSPIRLNWTKVGLKVLDRPDLPGERVEFELD